RREVLDGVVGKAFVRTHVDSEAPRAGEHQCVTIGWRFGHGLHRDDSVRARPVLDDHLLSEQLGEACRDLARHQIAHPARRKWRNDLYHLRRVALPVSKRDCGDSGGDSNDGSLVDHYASPDVVLELTMIIMS